MSNTSRDKKTKREDTPVLFFIPGTMRVTLTADGTVIWFDVHALAKGGFDKLAQIAPTQDDSKAPDGAASGAPEAQESDVERAGGSSGKRGRGAHAAGGPVVEVGATIWTGYTKLYRHLDPNYDIVPFPYDWRRSHREAGRKLAAEIERKLEATDAPIRILAHSTGGLVARAMILEAPQVWEDLCAREGCRLGLVGTPNGGALSTVRTLLGRDALTRGLASLDFEGTGAADRGDAARLPGRPGDSPGRRRRRTRLLRVGYVAEIGLGRAAAARP